ncbi:hypothetical protein Isop_0239 [Isosphaera pallida ATCC 43644]|uniref:Uncharacterized protein n=1 Tax=Isosphaera pallida (strain ATCC 43644 / DSM 9630 / IS1B) TaxID=575540 RepID=E8QWE9_ISOPI|nr:hypothetical protein Isop_0239 [Isosphaera pallida ATCC 43644]
MRNDHKPNWRTPPKQPGGRHNANAHQPPGERHAITQDDAPTVVSSGTTIVPRVSFSFCPNSDPLASRARPDPLVSANFWAQSRHESLNRSPFLERPLNADLNHSRASDNF